MMLLAVFFLALIPRAWACFLRDDNKQQGTRTSTDINPLFNKMGLQASDVQQMPDTDVGPFNAQDKAAGTDDPNDLSCNFDGPCCWNNAPPSEDQLEFLKSGKAPDPIAFSNGVNGGDERAPSGKYMITAAAKENGADQARLTSCSIACVKENIDVTFDFWTSGTTSVSVCTQSTQSPGALNDCTPVDNMMAPGPITVSLPGCENCDVVLMATNFGDPNGDIAIVDEVFVDWQPCGAGRETLNPFGCAAAQKCPGLRDDDDDDDNGNGDDGNANDDDNANNDDNGDDGNGNDDNGNGDDGNGDDGGVDPSDPMHMCNRVQCTDGGCDFVRNGEARDSPVSSMATTQWEEITGKFGNPVTGIREGKMGSSDPYNAVYIKANDRAVLDSGPIKLDQDILLEFDIVEAIQGVFIKGCLNDDRDCPFDHMDDVTPEHRNKWLTNSMEIPKDTERIIFVVENESTNQGAIGMDNFRVLDTRGRALCE